MMHHVCMSESISPMSLLCVFIEEGRRVDFRFRVVVMIETREYATSWNGISCACCFFLYLLLVIGNCYINLVHALLHFHLKLTDLRNIPLLGRKWSRSVGDIILHVVRLNYNLFTLG